jgi:hypothetical protein
MCGFLYLLGQDKNMPSSFLTRNGYEKLQDELEYLRTVKRQEVAQRLHEAMEGGELIEDAEYEAAKKQAFVEGRQNRDAAGQCRGLKKHQERGRRWRKYHPGRRLRARNVTIVAQRGP